MYSLYSGTVVRLNDVRRCRTFARLKPLDPRRATGGNKAILLLQGVVIVVTYSWRRVSIQLILYFIVR